MRLSLCVVVLCALFACKKSSSGKTNSSVPSEDAKKVPKGILIYQTKDDLPKCNKTNELLTVYVAKLRTFFSCEAKAWVAIELETTKQVVVEQSVTEAWREVWKKLVKSSAYIETKYTGTGCTRYESGSGFVVADDVVATNGHVVSPSFTDATCGAMTLVEVRLWYPEDTKGDTKHNVRGSDATIVEIDRTVSHSDDLALLKAPTAGRVPMPISAQDETSDHLSGEGIKLGDQVLQFGYSGASTFAHFVTGAINAIQKADDAAANGFLSSLVLDGLISEGKTVYEYDLVSGAGASGGAVANLKGEVVGVNFAGNTKDADTEFGYAIPAKSLRTLMADARNWEALSP